MVISSFISSILVLALGFWAYMRLESSMNIVAEKQLMIEPSKFSYKMWKDMPVTMYQSFTFFNLTNWNQVKSVGQKPKFVEVGPYVYRTIWTKSDINFMDEEKLVSFAEKKQWIFQAHLSKGSEEDQIWTINTPLMTALALIQNAPVITRNIVSVILDGLGEGAFIKRNIRSLLFEGYSDLIVSVGPLFDRRFSNFNGRFAYLYNKNDSVDGIWTVSTGTDDMSTLNKITRFQSTIVNMTSFSSGQLPQGLNEVKPECAPAWSLDQSTNGQLFSPFNRDVEQLRLQQQLQQLRAKARAETGAQASGAQIQSAPPPAPGPSKRFFSRSANHDFHRDHSQQQQPDLVPNPFLNQNQKQPLDAETGRQLAQDLLGATGTGAGQGSGGLSGASSSSTPSGGGSDRPILRDVGKYIFYPDLCRPIHLLPSKQEVSTANGIQASRYYIDPRVFMNSTQVPSNRCYEMNPRPPLANALAATINSVTGANVAMPNLVTGASSPFAMFSPPTSFHHHHHHNENNNNGGLFERSNHPTSSFLNNALHSFGSAAANLQQDQQASSSNNAPVSRLGRVRQLFSNIVSQRMSAGPGSLLPSLAAGPAGMLIGNHFQHSSTARNSPDHDGPTSLLGHGLLSRQSSAANGVLGGSLHHHHQAGATGAGSSNLDHERLQSSPNQPVPAQAPAAPPGGGGSDRWITQFRFKWPRGVFSIGQCQLGAPIYASLPHFLDADEYYLEQVDGLKPNRSLHEFYIDVESTLHSVPVGAKARLQLNVATPELRFRNIPNAMIPVLWQEVTFDIDKPIATMLYWSFTMSPTIYKLISLLLLAIGSILMVTSFVGGFKQRKRASNGKTEPSIGGETSHHNHHHHNHHHDHPVRPQQVAPQAGAAVSWLSPHVLDLRRHIFGNDEVRAVAGSSHGDVVSSGGSSCGRGSQHLRVGAHCRSGSSSVANNTASGSNHATFGPDEELRHGAALNHAFSSCAEFHDRLSVNGRLHNSSSSGSGPISSGSSSSGSSTSATTISGSPKQPSSRASSHCELVSSLGTNTVNCAGCLLACLRHTNNSSTTPNIAPNNHIHEHHLPSTSDNSLVIQQNTTTSDIIDGKATLSSRESNLDSCSSIYASRHHHTNQQLQQQQQQQRNRTFK